MTSRPPARVEANRMLNVLRFRGGAGSGMQHMSWPGYHVISVPSHLMEGSAIQKAILNHLSAYLTRMYNHYAAEDLPAVPEFEFGAANTIDYAKDIDKLFPKGSMAKAQREAWGDDVVNTLTHAKTKKGEAMTAADYRFISRNAQGGDPVIWSRTGFGIWGALRGLKFAYANLLEIGLKIQQLTHVRLKVDDIPHLIFRPPNGQPLPMHTDGMEIEKYMQKTMALRSLKKWETEVGVQMLAHITGGRGRAGGGTEVYHPMSVQRYFIMLLMAMVPHKKVSKINFSDLRNKHDYDWEQERKYLEKEKGEARRLNPYHNQMKNIIWPLISRIERKLSLDDPEYTKEDRTFLREVERLSGLQDYPNYYQRIWEHDKDTDGNDVLPVGELKPRNMADVAANAGLSQIRTGAYVFVWGKGLPHRVSKNAKSRLTVVLPFSTTLTPGEDAVARRKRIYDRVTLLASLKHWSDKRLQPNPTDTDKQNYENALRSLLTFDQFDRWHDGGCHRTVLAGCKTRVGNGGDLHNKTKRKEWQAFDAGWHKTAINSPELRMLVPSGTRTSIIKENRERSKLLGSFLPLYLTKENAKQFHGLDDALDRAHPLGPERGGTAEDGESDTEVQSEHEDGESDTEVQSEHEDGETGRTVMDIEEVKNMLHVNRKAIRKTLKLPLDGTRYYLNIRPEADLRNLLQKFLSAQAARAVRRKATRTARRKTARATRLIVNRLKAAQEKRLQEARLWRLLVETGAIEYVRTPMYRGIGMHPKHVSRGSIGHWWFSKPNFYYAERYEGNRFGTAVVGTPKKPLVFLRFQRIFDCGPIDHVDHDDGRTSRLRISDPTLRDAFVAFSHMPFLAEVRKLEMLADDNYAGDEFEIHKGKLRLNGTTIDGLSFLCDGDPQWIGGRVGEYWLLHPTDSMAIRKKRFETAPGHKTMDNDARVREDDDPFDTDVEYKEEKWYDDEETEDDE